MAPYNLYLNYVLPGLKDKHGDDFQDRVIYQWTVKETGGADRK